ARLWTTLFIAGRKDASLVREGPYAACRHPLYAASIVGAFGIGLTTRSAWLALLAPLAVAATVAFAARHEEAALERAHGVAWREYRASVPPYWPAWSRLRTPATVEVPVAIYRKAFLDAASFLALWFVWPLCNGLHAAGAWP